MYAITMFIDYEAERLPFFVYGSLLRGFYNYDQRIAPFNHTITPGTVNDVDMFAYRDAFPYVMRGTGVVTGEVVEVDAGDFQVALALLDELEGYSGPGRTNHYDRKIMTVKTAKGPVKAYMYLVSEGSASDVREGLPQVISGSWREHKAAVRRS
jgi:gamma-glutamylcyclotransferase (GGCT)/AIG2-like uncharacterized protein YtfP